MTTNEPDKLDEALTRPGRVDLHLRFALATAEEIRQIFIHMYSSAKKSNCHDPFSRTQPLTVEDACLTPSNISGLHSEIMPVNELHDLAAEFAKQVPEGRMSPADIQGYLLVHKRSPENALAGVREWVVQTLNGRDNQMAKTSIKQKQAMQASVREGEEILQSRAFHQFLRVGQQ